ncbi:MAG TPA: transcriptional regulator FeaR [Sphingomonadales bacterium]|nr:transcriptional regulator FeaR [Sphingomonadales bacterium]
METSYPTEMIAPAERADYWTESLKNVCGGFETFSSDWSKFKGRVELRNIGGFDVAGISVNADKIIRSRKQIAQGDNKYCFLIMQMQGRAVLSQRNNEAFLEPGDMTLIDSGYPSEFSYDGFMEQISLHIPRETLESCLPYRQIKEARTISGVSGMGAIIRDFLASTYNEAAYIGEQDYPLVRESLLNFLAATLRGYSPESTLDIKVLQLSHIRKIIEQNLTDPNLSPTMVAKLCGISTRHLHRLFKGDGVSFGEWVRRRRLSEARRQLANKHFSGQSIIQIAFHWGFNDAAHFSRCFRQEFGQSPRQYRLSERRL